MAFNQFAILIINLLNDKSRVFVTINDFDHALKAVSYTRAITL